MNGKGAVADKTRSRVRSVADRLGYTPSRSARGLAAGSTGNLGFVLNDVHFQQSEPFYTRVFLGAEFEARRRGQYVLLATIPESYDPDEHAPRFLQEHSVDGIVIAGRVDDAFLQHVRKCEIPFVLADYEWGDAAAVDLDNEGGGEAVAEHFLQRGHTRLAFYGADPLHPSPASRGAGFARAAAAAGHPIEDDLYLVCNGPLDRAAGAANASLLLDLPDRPTAVFCANDAFALGFMDAARARGFDIPGDLAVVGFDDVEGAALASPPLTTVRVFKEQLGEVALGLLADRTSAPKKSGGPGRFDRGSATMRIATQLVVRESS